MLGFRACTNTRACVERTKRWNACSLRSLYEGKFYYRYYDLYDCKHRKCARNVISGVDAFVFVISAVGNIVLKRIICRSGSQRDEKIFLCPLYIFSSPSCSILLSESFPTSTSLMPTATTHKCIILFAGRINAQSSGNFRLEFYPKLQRDSLLLTFFSA